MTIATKDIEPWIQEAVRQTPEQHIAIAATALAGIERELSGRMIDAAVQVQMAQAHINLAAVKIQIEERRAHDRAPGSDPHRSRTGEAS